MRISGLQATKWFTVIMGSSGIKLTEGDYSLETVTGTLKCGICLGDLFGQEPSESCPTPGMPIFRFVSTFSSSVTSDHS